jgi:hypothetical protein
MVICDKSNYTTYPPPILFKVFIMTTLTLFKSKSPVMGYVFRSGKTIHFVGGQYATSSPKEIEELNEVCQDSPNFYIDDGQKEIDSDAMDPMAVLTARIRKEIDAERANASNNPARELGGTSDDGKLGNIATSASFTGAAVASGTAQVGSTVVSVKSDMKASAPQVA